MWIESHESLGEHPKVFDLCNALKIDKPKAIGILHLLWHFTLKFAWRDGDLSKFSNVSIAHSIGWDGDPDKLIESLHGARWMEDKKIHDWFDYAGKIIKDRIYNEERRKTSLNGVSSRKISATQPNLTIPNLTKDKEVNLAFVNFWKSYPNKVGKGAAEAEWKKIKPGNDLEEKILKAVENQKKWEKWTKDNGQYIPNPSTWLHQKRWEDENNSNGGKKNVINQFQRLNELTR